VPYALLPDMDQELVDFLTAHASLAQLHGGRVGTELQSDLRAVRIGSLGGSQPWPWEGQPQYAIEWWGARADADQGPAKTLARTGEAALWELVGTEVTGGRVNGLSMPLSQLWSPDEDTARPRYITHVALIVMP
jgi:hypothetical protein